MPLTKWTVIAVEAIAAVMIFVFALATAPFYMSSTDGPFGPGSTMIASPDAGDGRWIAFTEYAPSGQCKFANSLNGMDTTMVLPEKDDNFLIRGGVWLKTQMTGTVRCETSAVAVPPIRAELDSWKISTTTTETVLLNEARRSGIGVIDPTEVKGRTPGFTFAGTTGPSGSTYYQALERLMPRTWLLDNGEPTYESTGVKCFVVRNDHRLSVESYMDNCAGQ